MARPHATPSTGLFDANKKLFFAVPFAYGYYTLEPYAFGEMVDYTIGTILCGFVAASLTIKGVRALYADYILRRDWNEAQSPTYSVESDNDGWASFAQMKAAGFYDGQGRILGTDLEGRLLFIPHILKPTHHWIEYPAGMGKTTCLVIASTLLTPLSPSK